MLCAFWPSVCLLGRNVFRSSARFVLGCLSLILICMSCLYILEINPLFIVSLANMFFHFVGCLFVLFMVSFAVQKHLSLLRSCLFLLLFVLFRVLEPTKMSCCHFCQSFLPMFSPKNFIVSGPLAIFKSRELFINSA